MGTRTLAELKRHSKAVGDHFFDPAASKSLGTSSIKGIYRKPYGELNEGYVVTVNDSREDSHVFVYMFQATDTKLAWFPIGRHVSLEDAESFIASMGATK